DASEHFSFVQSEAPDAAVGRESANFLNLIRQGQGRDTHLYGSLSYQYDTNVVLAPATGTPQFAISNAADSRVTVNVGGVYVPWHNERARLSVGYDFYLNEQFHLTS